MPERTVGFVPGYTVKLTYFKPTTGKYYSDGEYVTQCAYLFQIWDEVQRLRMAGTLPGLVDGARSFTILVDVPNHPHAHPKLLPLYAVELFDERYAPDAYVPIKP